MSAAEWRVRIELATVRRQPDVAAMSDEPNPESGRDQPRQVIDAASPSSAPSRVAWLE